MLRDMAEVDIYSAFQLAGDIIERAAKTQNQQTTTANA